MKPKNCVSAAHEKSLDARARLVMFIGLSDSGSLPQDGLENFAILF